MDRFEYWVSPKDKKYYWHFIRKNSDEIVCQSTQGLENKGDCIRAIQSVQNYAANSILVNLDKGAGE